MLDLASLALAVIGAISSGPLRPRAVRRRQLERSELLFGGIPALESPIYVIVGLAGLYFGHQLCSPRREVPATDEEPA